ncbi:MAG: hypothetical protein KDA45_16225, partial [Planctomycetales bacterium]|nr:hypothetical protein [Planctomycetales bacterium]
LPLEVLSRGTREAVFIALRLSLAAAYARRGVTIPLVLDDVLVNFDSLRAESAAKVLRDFASLGHQVIMFTCHEHIMKIFHRIDAEVRVLPAQGLPGEADCYQPPEPVQLPAPQPPSPEPAWVEPEESVAQEMQAEEVSEQPEEEEEETPQVELVEEAVEPLAIVEPAAANDQAVEQPKPTPPADTPPPKPRVAEKRTAPRHQPRTPVRRVVVVEQPEIDWLWYERNPDKTDAGWVESEDQAEEPAPPPDLWWNRGPNSLVMEE